MRRFALLFAFLAAVSVGMVPVADSVAKVEAAMAAGPAHHHGCDRACETHHAKHEHTKPHPGHCPACAALPAAFSPPVDVPAHGVPAVGGPRRLLAAFLPVDIPPPRPLQA